MALDSRGRARAGMRIDVGFVDSTGEPTLFICHFENQMNGVFRHTSEVFLKTVELIAELDPLAFLF
ncbi:MAG: hypothetical protein OXE59_06680 [Bacteroidetes bacterium]|nr:hypothetical protein [Bacteroidota bacterium]